MPPFDFIKLILGTWYIAYAVTATHGPGGVFEWMREHIWHGRRGTNLVVHPVSTTGVAPTERVPLHNGLLDCIICLAPWAALGLLLIQVELIRDVLAIAGGALLLHSFTGWRFGE